VGSKALSLRGIKNVKVARNSYNNSGIHYQKKIPNGNWQKRALELHPGHSVGHTKPHWQINKISGKKNRPKGIARYNLFGGRYR
jgi:hypothetical protein